MKRGVPSFGSSWKKQPAKRTRPSPKAFQQQIRSRKLNQQESKAFDTALAFSFDTTGEVPATGQLCFVTTGDTLANRDGAVIQVKSLQIRGAYRYAPAAGATAATNVYLYIVQDRQANGAAAAITDVLTSTNMSSALGNVPNQFRFKILKRIVLSLVASAGVTAAYNDVTGTIDEYIRFKVPLEIRYTASAGAIGDLASNNIFLLAGGDAGGDDVVTFGGTARLRFTG